MSSEWRKEKQPRPKRARLILFAPVQESTDKTMLASWMMRTPGACAAGGMCEAAH
jgi:hypothetical protein